MIMLTFRNGKIRWRCFREVKGNGKMKTIWKYGLAPECTQEIPRGGKILHVASQGDNMCLWVMVDPGMPKETRKFRVYGTGNIMLDNPGTFIGTVLMNGGSLVFHVFEE